MSDDLLKRGHKLGRYEVREMIGQGGMGQVYRAWDEVLGRDVAVKVMTVPDEAMLKRFAREAAAIGRLENHHVIEIHDLCTAGPHPYIVMEYLRGESLHARLQRGPLAIEDAVEVILGVCCGVNACHQVGIVHRDIKPANVFLSQTIEYGVVVKVLDFGVAKPVQIARHDDVTGPGFVVGTLRYLAPEHLRGAAADQLSDQYQIGLLLYVCLTGQPPFPGKEGKTLIEAILSADYPTLREQRGDVPAELEQVVLRAMEAERTERFPSVLEIARALVRYSGAQNREFWKQVFQGSDETPTASTAPDAIGSVMKVKSPVIGLDSTRVLQGDQLAMLAKKSVAVEPTVTLPKNWERQPAAQGSTLPFAPAPTARLDPVQELPQTLTRDLPAPGKSVAASPRVRPAITSSKRTRRLRLGFLAILLAVAGMGLMGALLLTRDRHEVRAPKSSKVLLPILAVDTRATDVTDMGDTGAKAQSPVGEQTASHDGMEEKSKRARTQDPEKKRGSRKGRGVEFTREGSLARSRAVAGDAEEDEEWLEKGVKLRRKGDHAGALRAFAQAHYLNPSGRTLGEIGLERQSLHEWKMSANALAVALGTSHEWVAKNRKYLEEALAAAKSHIGRLLVTGPAGSQLYVDGIGAGSLPLEPIQMDEGEHAARVEKAGMRAWATTVKITGGKVTEIMALLEVDKPASKAP